jgi:hypothetical protein
MKRFSLSSLIAGLAILCAAPTFGQDYPIWLSDNNQNYNEYPTAIASVPGATATVGIQEDEFLLYDIAQNPYFQVACNGSGCGGQEHIFVKWREEANGNTWTARIFFDGWLNNHVGAHSAPQVDINEDGEVYVSFTYAEIALVQDATGNFTQISNGNQNNYDLAVVKFDPHGNYVWHITEGGDDHDFVTDVDFNSNTRQLAIAGYVEGNSGMPFQSGGGINGLTHSSTLGANYPFGNAFTAVYEDNGSNANLQWYAETDVPAYSTDIALGNNGHVFLSGFYYETKSIAGKRLSNNYTDGGYIYNYFIAAFEQGGGTLWAQSYGSIYNELDISADKHLRNSSLAIIPDNNELFFAMNSTGGGSVYPFFGTYVHFINPNNGSVIHNLLVGNPTGISGSTYQNTEGGTPTYNPNITVDGDRVVHLTGNFLLTAYGSSELGIAFQEFEIGGTYIDIGDMFAARHYGHDAAVGWYTASLNMGNPSLIQENLNVSYVPANYDPFDLYNKVPAYGTSHDVGNTPFFFSALGFENGEIELDLTANHGFTNYYNNIGNAQYDGLLVRTYTGNGQYARPNNTATTVGASNVHSTLGVDDFSNSGITWTLSPNPVAAGQNLFWKSEAGAEQVEQIRLVDQLGRTLRTWQQPQASTQGFELPIGDLTPGVYWLEASGEAVQQTTKVVVQ